MGGEDDIPLEDGEHVVQFYASDAQLAAEAGALLAEMLVAGDAVVIIASTEHCDDLRLQMRDRGADVDAATSQGRLVMQDASSILQRCMVDGRPDRMRFTAAVGALVHSAGRAGRSVCAFGEMVTLLWNAGNVGAAMELERFWSDLAASTPFALLCAYPSDLFAAPRHTQAFLDVCRLHDRVVADAPAADADVLQRLPANADAPRRSRQLVATTLDSWNRRELVDACMLVVSELVANAVRYGGPDLSVALSREPGHDGGVRIDVGDGSRRVPTPQPLDPTALGGRGLRLVDNLAREWGHQPCERGKIVWAVVTQSPSPEAHSSESTRVGLTRR